MFFFFFAMNEWVCVLHPQPRFSMLKVNRSEKKMLKLRDLLGFSRIWSREYFKAFQPVVVINRINLMF